MPCTRRSTTALLAMSLCMAPLIAQTRGERTDPRFQMALGLMQRSLFEEAVVQWNRFLAEHPKDSLAPVAWYRLAVCHLELADHEAAAKALQTALTTGGSAFTFRFEARYRLGHLHQEQGRSKEAVRILRPLVAELPDGHLLCAPAGFALAEAQRASGDGAAAQASFVAAAVADRDPSGPYAAPALYAAGFLARDAGQHKEAAAHFETVVARFAEHPAAMECQLMAGEAWLAVGELDRARRRFEAVAASDSILVPEATFALARLHGPRDQQAALRSLEAVQRMAPGTPLALRAAIEAARIHLQRGEPQRALALLADAALPSVGSDLDPLTRAAALELRAVARQQGKDLAGARADLEQALALPLVDAARLRCRLAGILAEAGDHEAAALAYEKVIREAGDDDNLLGEALYGRGLALHRLSRHREALTLFQDLAQRRPPHRLAVYASFASAESLFDLGESRAARPLYQQVPADHELEQKARLKIAWCDYLHGEHKAAAVAFESVAQPGGDGPLLAESLAMATLAWFEAGQEDKALSLADRMRARHPESTWLARTERIAARVLSGQGELAAAAQRLARATAAEPDPDLAAADRLQQADLVLKQGDVEAARAHYQELSARLDRTGAGARYGLAFCAFELGDDGACLRETEAVLQHPAGTGFRPMARELQVVAHHRRGRHLEAAKAARLFLAEHPGHERTHALQYALGVALARAGQDDEARSVLAPLVQEPACVERDRAAYELAHACLRGGDTQAAAAAFALVVELTKDSMLRAEGRLQGGELAAARGEALAAASLFRLVDGPHRQRARYQLGVLLREGGSDLATDLEAARSAFDEAAAEAGPLSDVARLCAGELAFRAGDHRDAVARLQPVVRRAAESTGKSMDRETVQTARLLLGQCLVELQRADEAVSVLEAFLAAAGDQDRVAAARAGLACGRAHAALSDRSAAETHFKKVTLLVEGAVAAEARFRLGELRLAHKDLDGAIEALLELTVLYGDSEWVRRGLALAADCFDQKQQPAKAQRLREEMKTRFPEDGKAPAGRRNGDGR